MLGWSWRWQLPLPQDCVVFQAFSSPMFFFSSKEPVLWDKEPTLWDFWQACTAHRGVLWAEAEGKQGTQLEALPLSKARNKMKSHPVSPLTLQRFTCKLSHGDLSTLSESLSQIWNPPALCYVFLFPWTLNPVRPRIQSEAWGINLKQRGFHF